MQHLYSTSDLGLASFLYALGYHLEALNRNDPRRVEFCFERNQEMDAAIEAYWQGKARIAPLALLSSQKLLKHQIYDRR